MCGGGGVFVVFFPASCFFALGKGGVSVNLTVLRRSSFPMHISERMPLSLGFVAEHWRGNPFYNGGAPMPRLNSGTMASCSAAEPMGMCETNKNSSGFNCSAIEALWLPQM